MLRDVPAGFLITWTCYGTWLHGDERGAVDRAHAGFSTDRLPRDPDRRGRNRSRLKHAAVTLDARQREAVGRAIRAHADAKGWPIHALNVRTNHVHVVCAYAGVPVDRMLTGFKAWATRRLRDARLVDTDVKIWTRHGSTRYLWDEESVAAAVDYVELGQDVPR